MTLMNSLRKKLGNCQGVSMIIAMVFMLICLFVGGVVLTTATVNSYRMKHKPRQQEFLDQRSAATLIADELDTGSDKPMRLLIHEYGKKYQSVTVQKDGTVVVDPDAAVKSRQSIVFEVEMPDGMEMTALQRTVFETAILNFLRQNSMKPGGLVSISFKNFNYEGTDIADCSTMWLQPSEAFWNDPANKDPAGGSVNLESTDNVIPKFSTNFRSESRDGWKYDYVADFGAYSQLEVRMYASVGKNKNPAVEEIVEVSGGKHQKVTTNDKLTVISWTEPMIVKGDSV